jgi:ketosteroid isomerase-like protein
MNPSETVTTAQINDLEDRRYAAMVDTDLDTLDDLLSDDVIYTHSDASVDTKKSYLNMLRSGRLVYLAVEHTTDLVLTRPGVAIVAGTMSGSIRMHGAAKTLNSRIAAVWVTEGGRWRLAAFQATPITGTARGPSGRAGFQNLGAAADQR